MKLITTKRFLAAAAFIAASYAASEVMAGTIAMWTFETSQPTTAGPAAAEVGTGSATGSHAGAAVYSSPAGNGSAHSYSANTWAVGDYWQFTTSTLGSSDIAFQWDQTSSGTGPRDFKVQYSTDGTTFTDVPYSYSVLANASPNPTWNATTSSPIYTSLLLLNSITALNNQAAIYLRLVDTSTTSAAGGTVATAGTDRVDNVTIYNNVPEPSSLFLAFMVGGSVGVFRRRRA